MTHSSPRLSPPRPSTPRSSKAPIATAVAVPSPAVLLSSAAFLAVVVALVAQLAGSAL